MTPTWRARVLALLGAGTAVVLASMMPTMPAGASGFVAVSGSGSSWASVAIDLWAQDVRSNGLVVNYNPDGSAAGRGDYMANQDDFAGSDPPFRDGQDKLGGTGAEHPSQGYSYVPDTAGGTAFIYHITVGGKLITNLRLDPKTIFEIFTGQIKNWDDHRITHIYGAQLPNLPITPVIRSDGSGATFFFTKWLSSLYPSAWNKFCDSVHPGIGSPCGNTEFYPQFGAAKAENGSNNVITYITSSFGNGSIGYDEYAYALNAHFPVVQVLNPDKYFVGPTASNVAVALTQAIINTDKNSSNYLQQDLHKLYTFRDPRNYPISSYSYLIVPRAGRPEPTNFSNAKGATLSTWINFVLCAGQRQMKQLGYSPLPENLVQGGLTQNGKIPGHVHVPSVNQLSNCDNPTMQNGHNILLATAPEPSPCQKLGAPLNCVVKNGKAVAAGAGGNSAGPKASASASAGAATTGTGTGTGTTTGATGPVTGVVVNLAGDHSNQAALGALTAFGIVLAVALPPGLAVWLRRRRGQARG